MASAKTTRQWLAGLSLLGALAFAAAPAAAQIDAGKLAASKTASTNFLALAKGSETSGNAPRESDPAVKRLLETVFDSTDVQAAKSVTFQQLGPLTERMMNGVRVGVAYMLAGTGTTDLSQIAADAEGAVKVNLNVIKFAPEMGRFFDFQLYVQGAVADGTMARLASAKPEELARPNFQSGLADIRQGSARAVAGAIETLAVNGITEEWRRDRLPALRVIAPRLAKLLLPDQKAELKQLAIACADLMDDAQVKKTLQDFAAVVGG
jgi:hypothetical protein